MVSSIDTDIVALFCVTIQFSLHISFLITQSLCLSPPSLVNVLLRYITILSPEADPLRSVAGKPEEGVDLRTLRAIRVLRPLKLVSGVPSKCDYFFFSLVTLLSRPSIMSEPSVESLLKIEFQITNSNSNGTSLTTTLPWSGCNLKL